MKNTSLSIIVCILALSGCAHRIRNYQVMEVPNKPDFETAKTLAEQAIIEKLKDPESARFKSATPLVKMLYNYSPAATREAIWGMCMEVNAKNSLGGYTGFQWWYVKFRDSKPITNAGTLGVGQGDYDCRRALKSPGGTD